MGKVVAVCVSETRGVQKENKGEGVFDKDWGLRGDAHAGHWHRQVSLLSADEIAAFNEKGAGVQPGAFGENLVVEGIDFRRLPVGTQLGCGDVLLQISQIGKGCHYGCAIRQAAGGCVMPREGIFVRVLEGGIVRPGDSIALEEGPEAADPAAQAAGQEK